MFSLLADPEAAVLRLVQSRCALYVVDHLPSLYDLHRSLPGVQLPAALRSRHQQAVDRHQDLNRLGRVLLYRRPAVRSVDARQSPVATSLQR